MTSSYVCIDLETTGLNPKHDKIIEIGAVKVIEGKIVDTFSCFVNPQEKLSDRVIELTGIKDEDLENAPLLDEIFPEVEAFLEDLPLLGHSILFDYSFLKKAAVDRRRPFEKRAIDTLKIARKYLAELEHRNLEYLCNYYEIPHHAHRALEDARATEILFRKLEELFYSEEEVLFEPRPMIFHVKKDTPATKAQKERLYRLVSQHKIDLGKDIEGLSRSEASRLTDRILSNYGR